MATLEDFRAYQPQLSSVSDATITAYLARAARWSARVIGTKTIGAVDQIDAECAYVIFLIQQGLGLRKSGQVGTIKLQDRGEVTVGTNDLAALECLSADQEAQAWQHLYDGGYPFTTANTGVAR